MNQTDFNELLKKAEAGDAKSQYLVALDYDIGNLLRGAEPDVEKVIYWYTKSAQQGYAEAQNELAVCYEQGKYVKKDLKVAAYWYEKAAAQNHALANKQLGYLYKDGAGVEKNKSKADLYFKKSLQLYLADAERGDEFAMYMVGECYFFGDGVEKDLDIAKSWYEKAAALGDQGAIEALEEYYE